MIKKLITLFKLGRKVAKSDILSIGSKFKKPPVAITILFQLLSISFSKSNQQKLNTNEGERLSNSLESMGTTFIKLGQFLATRPDIIGEELSAKLENLQDRLPPFSINQAKEIIKKVAEGRPHVVDAMKNLEVNLIVNTTEGRQSILDSASIRRTALEEKIYCTTTLEGGRAVCSVLRNKDLWSVERLQDLHSPSAVS